MNTKWASLRVEVGWQAFDAGRAGFNPTRPSRHCLPKLSLTFCLPSLFFRTVCLFGFYVTLQDSFFASLCRLTFGLPCVWLEIESCLLRPPVSLRDSRRSLLEEHSGAILRRAR
ncbi:hypothetical protein M9H77_08585 [Catharanthus roseus]|uniref:Uncharacterized protein n=1 Tax=Catharanthus roseus TaxID=4058 RepID=A0ACC0BYA9_CATRO|nr:hypothetical protein M9H77_08585 [Catharanthus roseus]